MSTTAGAVKVLPFRGTGRGGRVVLQLDVAIGNSGAATYDRQDDPGLTCVKNTTGVYDVTFPPCRNARILTGVLSASLTVVQAVVTAMSASAGTATIKTLLNDAAAEPASGNKVWLTFILDSQNV